MIKSLGDNSSLFIVYRTGATSHLILCLVLETMKQTEAQSRSIFRTKTKPEPVSGSTFKRQSKPRIRKQDIYSVFDERYEKAGVDQRQ